jgi:adenylate cyclase
VSDIFALQDEIAEAIVGALKLKLLPEEKRAIERRGTESVEAYNFYLMARQLYLAGRSTSAHGSESIVRLCSGATNIDPDYAQAWALMALAQAVPTTSQSTDRGSAAADRALYLDPSLAEAHVAKGRVLYNKVDLIAARKEYEAALALDPELFEANMNAGLLELTDGRHEAAVALLEKAAALSPDNPNPVITLLYTYRALGNSDAERRTAKLLLQDAERILAQQPDDTNAMGFAVQALGVLGEGARAREMMARGMLLDPENGTMKLHFVQALAKLNEIESALELAESMMNSPTLLLWLSAGAKNTQLAVHPRFVAMLTEAESRLNPALSGGAKVSMTQTH